MVSQIVDTTAVILVTHFMPPPCRLLPMSPYGLSCGIYSLRLRLQAAGRRIGYRADLPPVRYLRPWLGLKENEEATG